MSASFIDLFSDESHEYASARPSYPDELFDFVAENSPSLECVWDCGTGNGQAAIALAGHFQKVLASDASQAQISAAIPHERVTYSVQTAEHTNYPDRCFDAICVAQALHWFDLDKFFSEAKGVAKPGALFAAFGYSWFEVSPEFDAAFKALIMTPSLPYWHPNIHHLWNGYRDVKFPFPLIDAPSFEVNLDWSFEQLMAFVGSWSGIKKARTELGDSFLVSAEATLRAHWGESDVRQVRMPLNLLAGRV